MRLLLNVVFVIAVALVEARPTDRSGNFMLLKIPTSMQNGYSVTINGILRDNTSPLDKESEKIIMAQFPGTSGEKITISYEFTTKHNKLAITMHDGNTENKPNEIKSEYYDKRKPEDPLTEFELKLYAAVNRDGTHRFDIIYNHNFTGPIHTDTSVSKTTNFDTVLINENIATVTSLLFELNWD